MLRALLLEGSSSKAWVDKVLGIMLTLNAMPHEPHGFSASMIAIGREPTLSPDVRLDSHPSPLVDNLSDYVEAIKQRLQLTHQQVTSPPSPPVSIPYHVGSLIYALITPPERTSKLLPRWKGSYRVCRIPNDYQVVYEDGELARTIHINHAKPAKFTAPDLPEPVPTPGESHPPLWYLPAGLAKPRPPPAAAAPAENSASPSAAAPANQQPQPASRPRRSPRLNPEPGHARTIKSLPGNPPHHSPETTRMARTYLLTVSYNEYLAAEPLLYRSRTCVLWTSETVKVSILSPLSS